MLFFISVAQFLIDRGSVEKEYAKRLESLVTKYNSDENVNAIGASSSLSSAASLSTLASRMRSSSTAMRPRKPSTGGGGDIHSPNPNASASGDQSESASSAASSSSASGAASAAVAEAMESLTPVRLLSRLRDFDFDRTSYCDAYRIDYDGDGDGDGNGDGDAIRQFDKSDIDISGRFFETFGNVNAIAMQRTRDFATFISESLSQDVSVFLLTTQDAIRAHVADAKRMRFVHHYVL